MKRKIISIPPKYFYLSIIIIIAARFLLPQFNVIIFPYNVLGVILFLVGFYFIFWTWKIFKKYNTPENFDKSTKLVTEGLFRFSRNPMYLGGFLILFGLFIFVGNLVSLLGPVLYFLFIHFMFIPFEEEKNEKTFGQEFIDYKKRTRKWI